MRLAITALILLVMLSWNILSGILNSNPGSYVLAAFISGFSERYFLNLLKIEPENEAQKKTNT